MKRIALVAVALAMLAVLSTATAYAAYPNNWFFAQDDAVLDFSTTPGNPGTAGSTFTVTSGTLAKYNDALSVLGNFVISGVWTGVVTTPTEYVTTYASTLTITGVNAYAGGSWIGSGNLFTRVQKTSVASGNPLFPDTYLTSSLGLPVPINGTLQPTFSGVGDADFFMTSASGSFAGIPEFVAPWLGTYNWRYDFDASGLPVKQYSNVQGMIQAVPEPSAFIALAGGLVSLLGFRRRLRK